MKIYKILAMLPVLLFSSCGDDTPKGADLSKVQPAADFVDPRDGKTYKCIQVGDQIWMAENLAYFPSGGTLDGCYTWQQLKATTASIPIDDDLFAEIWIDTAYDPDHKWVEETGMEDYRYVEYLNMYFLSGLYPQSTLLNMFASPAQKPFMTLFTEKKQNYIDTHLDEFADLFKWAADEVDKTNGNYSSKYGYLYSFEGAKKAAPEGWRVPTDADWIKFERALGISQSDCEQLNAWRGEGVGEALKNGGSVGFNALFSGSDAYCGGGSHLWTGLEESAYFWVDEINHITQDVEDGDEENDDESGDGDGNPSVVVIDEGLVRQLSLYSSKVWRGTTRISTTRDILYSVRCVKDVR